MDGTHVPFVDSDPPIVLVTASQFLDSYRVLLHDEYGKVGSLG
jgi:hypothetical protein